MQYRVKRVAQASTPNSLHRPCSAAMHGQMDRRTDRRRYMTPIAHHTV